MSHQEATIGTPNTRGATPVAREPLPRVVHVPRVDLYGSRGGDVVVVADLPGVRQEDVEITVDENILTIAATVDQRAPEGYRRIRGPEPTRCYRRTFTLADVVDREGIQATMRDGTLRLTVPKLSAARPRKIPVQAAA